MFSHILEALDLLCMKISIILTMSIIYLRHLKEAGELLYTGCSVMLLRLLSWGDQGGLPGPEGRQWMWQYCKHQNNLSDLPFILQRPWQIKKATRGYPAGYIALVGIIQLLGLLLSISNLTGAFSLCYQSSSDIRARRVYGSVQLQLQPHQQTWLQAQHHYESS